MAAVAGIDDGYRSYFSGIKLCTLYMMAHSDDIGETAYNPYGVLYRLSLAYRAAVGIRESEYVAAELHHCGGKAEARTGAWFVKQSGQFLPLAGFGVAGRICDYIESEIEDFLGLT